MRGIELEQLKKGRRRGIVDSVVVERPSNQVLSNLDQYRMYDPWLELNREGRSIIRLQDELSAEPERPRIARAERASSESIPVLRG
jgi:hypothetical protein